MKIFTFCISALLIITLASCSDNGKNENPRELVFNVDTALVTDPVQFDDLGISLCIPVNWNSLDSSTLDNVIKGLEKIREDSALYHLSPSAVYLNKKTSNLLSVGEVAYEGKNDSLSFKEYISEINTAYDTVNVVVGKFIVNDINVTQLLIRNDKFILFKLLFLNKQTDMIEVDFALQKTFYNEAVKSVESSIGSLKYINK